MSWIKMWVFERQFPALMCVKKLNRFRLVLLLCTHPQNLYRFWLCEKWLKKTGNGHFFRQMNQFNNLHFYRYLIMQKKSWAFVTRFPSKSVICAVAGCVINFVVVAFKVVTSLILSKVAASKPYEKQI